MTQKQEKVAQLEEEYVEGDENNVQIKSQQIDQQAQAAQKELLTNTNKALKLLNAAAAKAKKLEKTVEPVVKKHQLKTLRMQKMTENMEKAAKEEETLVETEDNEAKDAGD